MYTYLTFAVQNIQCVYNMHMTNLYIVRPLRTMDIIYYNIDNAVFNFKDLIQYSWLKMN